MKWSFDYGITSVRDLEVSGWRNKTTNRLSIKTIKVKDETVTPTPRFWKSFFTRFGISDNVFRYFEPAEVFDRISDRSADDHFRYVIERGDGTPNLLAVSNQRRPYITYDHIQDLVGHYDGTNIKYDRGIVTSTHTPRSGSRTFEIGGDQFKHQFVMETPVDGFSHPKIYLSFLRMVCSNGMIGYSRAFRSDISMGKDLAHCITRALDSFDNGEGYAALRQRFESAQLSWASVHECSQLYKLVSGLGDASYRQKTSMLSDVYKMTGNMNELYGLANMDALSVKRQRVLPSRCRIYDLLNFASEVATHHASTLGGRMMQAYIGSLISDEYDLEGTAETATQFNDFFVSPSESQPTSSLN